MPQLTINPNIQAKYLDNPDKCPYCNGDNLSGTAPEFSDSKTVTREVECIDCREEWMEVFQLSAMESNQPA